MGRNRPLQSSAHPVSPLLTSLKMRSPALQELNFPPVPPQAALGNWHQLNVWLEQQGWWILLWGSDCTNQVNLRVKSCMQPAKSQPRQSSMHCSGARHPPGMCTVQHSLQSATSHSQGAASEMQVKSLLLLFVTFSESVKHFRTHWN